MTLAVRTASEPLVLATEIRGALAQIDLDLALTRVRTMEAVVYSSVGEPRIRAILLGAFALVALALALHWRLRRDELHRRSADVRIWSSRGAGRYGTRSTASFWRDQRD
jgi:hypothetical protein